MDTADQGVPELVADLYRTESRRVLATLIRLLGDFELAAEALPDPFTAAAKRWPRDRVPEKPRAWLVSTGRFIAIDGLRRRARFNTALAELARQADTSDKASSDAGELEDD